MQDQKVFTAQLQFNERECYQLAGMYLGLAHDYQETEPENIFQIQRCEAMAGMFISFMPLSRQNEFRKTIDLLLQDPELAEEYDRSGAIASKKIFDLLKSKWQ
jgi:hypothetical protein